MTYYDLLNVSSSAPVEVINAAWRVMSKSAHPDMPTGSTELSQKLNEAHEVLSDADKRKAYDAFLKTERKQRRREAKVQTQAPPQVPIETVLIETGMMYVNMYYPGAAMFAQAALPFISGPVRNALNSIGVR